MELAELRMKRAEQDIETLRTTQRALVDRFAGIAVSLDEVREIVSYNRARLDRIEARLDVVEARLDQLDQVVLENRAILLAIADHLDLTYEKPS